MLSTADQTAFAQALLQYGGAPVTPASVAWLRSWFAREGTSAAWNPLATTQHYTDPLTGQTSMPLPGNSAGVQQYPSMQAGVAATWRTITNGNYPNVVMALHSGNPGAYDQSGMLAPDLSTWSGGGYTSVVNTPARDTTGSPQNIAGGGVETVGFHVPGPVSDYWHGLEWLWGGGPIRDGIKAGKATVDTADSAAKALTVIAGAVAKFGLWVADRHHWLRIGEVLAGGIAAYLGLKLLSEVDGLGVLNQIAAAPTNLVDHAGHAISKATKTAGGAAALAAA